jgi:hypothetical protein
MIILADSWARTKIFGQVLDFWATLETSRDSPVIPVLTLCVYRELLIELLAAMNCCRLGQPYVTTYCLVVRGPSIMV